MQHGRMMNANGVRSFPQRTFGSAWNIFSSFSLFNLMIDGRPYPQVSVRLTVAIVLKRNVDCASGWSSNAIIGEASLAYQSLCGSATQNITLYVLCCPAHLFGGIFTTSLVLKFVDAFQKPIKMHDFQPRNP